MPGLGELIILFIILALVAVPLVLVVWSVVDAARRSNAEFKAAGQQRILWIVLPLALMVVGLGWIAAIIYLAVIRPKLARASR